jgi:hypothetical protein
MTSSDRVACVLALALVVTTTRVRADVASDLESARLYLQQGNHLRETGDLRGALAKYKAAQALAYTPITGLEVGRTHLALGELVEAREVFLAVGRIPVKAQESQNAASARIEADRLARETEPRIPTLTIAFEGMKKDATPAVTFDGHAIPFSPSIMRRVNPGAHSIRATTSGAKDASLDVQLGEGESRAVTLRFEPVEAAAPVKAPDRETPKTAPVESSRTSPLVVAGFGLSAGALVVGAVTGVMTLSKRAALADECPGGLCGPQHQDDLRRAKTFATISTISFGVAAAGAVLGVVGVFDSKRAHVGVGLGTVTFSGVF